MQINIIKSIEDAHMATGLTVVIDVFRAFTTEAYIFANGAEKIIPVKDLEAAYNLKKESPDYILVGERGGIKPAGFDFGNGPSEIVNINFSGKTIVHTTSNGTKGLLDASQAEMILTGSFVLADSIVKYIKDKRFQNISLISTSPELNEENEDLLLAYYIRDMLTDQKINEGDIKNKLLTTSARSFLLNEAGVPQADIDLCLEFNKFNFVIKKVTENNSIYLVRENLD